MKRTELQAAAVATFGKQAAAWTGPATNVELREALATGTPGGSARARGDSQDSPELHRLREHSRQRHPDAGSGGLWLIEALEYGGRRCEVVATHAVAGNAGDTREDVIIVVLCHPAMLRRLQFALDETLPRTVRDDFGFRKGRGYGHPRPTSERTSSFPRRTRTVSSGQARTRPGRG